MGMFDSVIVQCPRCDFQVEFQSKAGECILARYRPSAVPMAIALALDNESEHCSGCGHKITLHMPMRIDKVCMVTS